MIHARTTERSASRPDHLSASAVLAPLLLALALLALATHAAAAAAPDRPLTASELTSVHGGTCGSSCDSDDTGGSSGSDDSDDADPVGTAYWVEDRRVLRSSDRDPAELADYMANRSDTSLEHTFVYRYRLTRNIGFSGGYASYFSIKVGGEIDQTWERRATKVLKPWQVGKIYTSQQTDRYRTYGKKYQDYDDGSRKVINSDAGPYTRSWTRTSYVTYSLN